MPTITFSPGNLQGRMEEHKAPEAKLANVKQLEDARSTKPQKPQCGYLFLINGIPMLCTLDLNHTGSHLPPATISSPSLSNGQTVTITWNPGSA